MYALLDSMVPICGWWIVLLMVDCKNNVFDGKRNEQRPKKSAVLIPDVIWGIQKRIEIVKKSSGFLKG